MDFFYNSGAERLSQLVSSFLAIYLEIFRYGILDLFSRNFIVSIVSSFRTLGWVLFSAGFVIALLEYIIEAQSSGDGDGWVKLSFNTAKGFIFCSCFASIPIMLINFFSGVCSDMAKNMSGGLYSVLFEFANYTSGLSWAENLTQSLGFSAVITTTTASSTNVFIGLIAVILVIVFGFGVVMSNISRAGALLTLILVGVFHAFSIPRGYLDSATGWCKQVIGLVFTHFMQNLLLLTGFYIFSTGTGLVTFFSGIGTMFAANMVPKIAQQFSLDTSIKGNISGGLMVASGIIRGASGTFSGGSNAINKIANKSIDREIRKRMNKK
ncbi:MAG: DUF6045 family protein [Acutalibacteraceae bacterium]|nr:DUF6045 family protein [Acutalibacteraceae bacterium]